ncbi:SDR family NAD(P)-dependent oxidoreductase [Aequorivita xiaoshiensis]|uniref:SDR family NAD(P)-dependent oxidoreductase n=1 Tax=Aequorivita xiaoshiensis TaxID=2874476 RepID=A0A9X1R296_9FLAO|nr:SDR family NAD(P)-dependent oxidoreductase [Aequorivita xiaoshiensis]MCG2429729.1 SDR family NAD(P)-dependent oxidoreductase [Aequorivita xiaoshiensis]
MQNKIAFITGATSGIGMATAKLFARNGLKLIICGRRKDRLESLAKELSLSTEVHTLSFDVRNKEEVISEINSLPKNFSNIDILINNAGNAHGLENIDEGSIDDWDAMLDINVKGLLYVSKSILPKMIERKCGHIINIGSTAGKEVYPKGNVYCASKHAVDAINQGMRIDLNGKGIKVGAINPGLVETEFSKVRFKGDTEKADQVYQRYTPLKPKDIAEVIWFAVTRPPHVNIADLTVMCLDQASSTIINKF